VDSTRVPRARIAASLSVLGSPTVVDVGVRFEPEPPVPEHAAMSRREPTKEN
jgi:hypothetical protein